MTRRDYVAIAAALKSALDTHPTLPIAAGICVATRNIAEVMARDNPRFDRARFLKACGVQS